MRLLACPKDEGSDVMHSYDMNNAGDRADAGDAAAAGTPARRSCVRRAGSSSSAPLAASDLDAASNSTRLRNQ